jgi:hypothetical protein
MNVRERVREAVDWIHEVQGRNQWRALVITIMSFQVP